jgi:hypothetical protein
MPEGLMFGKIGLIWGIPDNNQNQRRVSDAFSKPLPKGVKDIPE